MTATELFPQTYGGWPCCEGCWRPAADLARTWNPDTDQETPLCPTCAAAVENDRPIVLPTAEEREQAWRWLAIQHHNHKLDGRTGVTDAHIDRALATLTSEWMPPQIGWQLFEQLQDALLCLQHAEDPATVLGVELIGPKHTPETYRIHCQRLVDGALRKLVGRQP